MHTQTHTQNQDSFNPDRWITGDAASKPESWLAFGAGPHKCLGQRLVTMTLAHMIGKAAVELYWENHSTSRSEEFNVVATVISMVSSASLGPLRRS